MSDTTHHDHHPVAKAAAIVFGLFVIAAGITVLAVLGLIFVVPIAAVGAAIAGAVIAKRRGHDPIK